jgi:hypothetical protein
VSDLDLEEPCLLSGSFCRFDVKLHGILPNTVRDFDILASQIPSGDGMTDNEKRAVTIPWFLLLAILII